MSGLDKSAMNALLANSELSRRAAEWLFYDPPWIREILDKHRRDVTEGADMASEFKVGDVVKLKSGSLAMTVEHIGNDGALMLCVWFELDTDSANGGEHYGQPRRDMFPAETLVAVPA